MRSVHETAYPRLKDEFTEQELVAIYTPTPEELRFVAARYRQVTLQTFLLIQLKLLQRLGYFIMLGSVPPEVVQHICSRAQVRVPTKTALTRYDKSGTKQRHRAHLRQFVGRPRLGKALAATWAVQKEIDRIWVRPSRRRRCRGFVRLMPTWTGLVPQSWTAGQCIVGSTAGGTLARANCTSTASLHCCARSWVTTA